MYHAMNEIFRVSTESDNIKFKIKVSFLEIYNESIRDLISPSSEIIELREDPVKGV